MVIKMSVCILLNTDKFKLLITLKLGAFMLYVVVTHPITKIK